MAEVTKEDLNQAGYKYYAFISYSRRDARAASYFQRKMEHFRIPTKYVEKKYLPNDCKFPRPVFRDRRDLEVGERNFTKDVRDALAASRYLVVLCSPNSSASDWVDKEVRFFLETHNNDLLSVVPVIMSGDPSGGDAERECLPPSLRTSEIRLRNLPTMMPDAGDSQKVGWENGVVQTLSYLLRVKRERIKATVDAERLRIMKRCVMAGSVCTIAFAGLSFWALSAERKANEQRNRAVRAESVALASKELAVKREKLADASLSYIQNVFSGGLENGTIEDLLQRAARDYDHLKDLELKKRISPLLALVLQQFGLFNDCYTVVDKAMPLFQDKIDDLRGRADLSTLWLLKEGDAKTLEEAERCLNHSWELRVDDAPQRRLEVLRRFAALYDKYKRYDKSVVCWSNVLEVATSTGNTPTRDYAYEQLARICAMKGNTGGAMSLLRKRKKFGSLDGEGIYAEYIERAKACSMANDFDGAIMNFTNAFALTHSVGVPDSETVVSQKKMFVNDCKIWKRYEIGLSVLRELRNQFPDDERLMADEIFFLRNMNQSDAIPPIAEMLEKALRIKLVDVTNRVEAIESLALLCAMTDRHAESAQYLEMAFKERVKHHGKHGFVAWGDIEQAGDIYLHRLKSFAKAKECYMAALHVQEEVYGTNSVAVARSIVNVLMAELSGGIATADSERLLGRGIRILEADEDPAVRPLMARALMLRAGFNNRKGERSAALADLDFAREKLDGAQNADAERMALDLLYRQMK